MLPAGPPQKRRSLRGRKEPGEKRLDIPATSHQIHIVALQSLVPLVEPGHLAARLVQVQNLPRTYTEPLPLARELAEHTAHYYDRGYIRREKYRI